MGLNALISLVGLLAVGLLVFPVAALILQVAVMADLMVALAVQMVVRMAARMAAAVAPMDVIEAPMDALIRDGGLIFLDRLAAQIEQRAM